MKFKALRTYKEENRTYTRLEESTVEELSPGNVIIKAHYSSINYKDALAVTGKGRILKNLPLIAGIDVCGEIQDSDSAEFKSGDLVLVTGCGLGETQDGGYSQILRVPSKWIVPLPKGLDPKAAMILGTAGFTAALCLHRLQVNGQSIDKGPLLITGASGGVGQIATHILSSVGYEVTAVSGKKQMHSALKKLGAKEVLLPEELKLGSRPLEKARWAGAIDNVGGEILAGLSRHIGLWGNIACVGLASSHELNTTVMPFILRGVSLLGISSANCTMELRKQLWQNLAGDLKPKALAAILNKEIGLAEIVQASHDILNRKSSGRILVNCQK